MSLNESFILYALHLLHLFIVDALHLLVSALGLHYIYCRLVANSACTTFIVMQWSRTRLGLYLLSCCAA